MAADDPLERAHSAASEAPTILPTPIPGGSGADDESGPETVTSAEPSSGAILDGKAPGPLPSESQRSIGRYKLQKILGKGGFGIVWQAEQTEPIHREVALKIIKPGMDSQEISARFEGERQALALMDHPNIAAVLDAGTTEQGRPYFVMELVRGVPITDYCDVRRLTIRQRLELFIPVCQAVQHAHQKAIIHRDLKPSNILVEQVDDRGVPKVIDFGIAKALGASLQGDPTLTREGMVVGTPQYMSPEQAGSARDVDTRSDIYTLGIILYQLLTGHTPLQAEPSSKGAVDQILQRVRDGVTKRPSSRLAPASGAVEKIATARGSDPQKLAATLRGDVDWIVLKALETERERRYETANALAKDLQRYLDCEPVSAGPPSAGYRLRKLIQRNRAAFAAALGMVLVLVVGVVVSTWQAVRARRAERLSQERLQQAEHARDAAEGLIADAIFGLRDKLVPLGKVSVLDGMQKAAEDYYARLPAELASATTRHHQARLGMNRALVAAARSDDIATEALATEALDKARKLAAEYPDDLRFLEDEMAPLVLLAFLRTEQDAPEEAGVYGAEAATLADQWLKRDPKAPEPLVVKLSVQGMRMVGVAWNKGIAAEVVPTFAEMRELSARLKALGQQTIETSTVDAMAKFANASLLTKIAGPKLAAPAFRDAVLAFEETLKEFGEHSYTRQMLLVARNYEIGNLQTLAKQTNDATAQAEAEQQKFALAREREKLTELEPLHLDWWKELASSYGEIAVLLEPRDPKAALEWAEKAYAAGEKAASPRCDRPRFRQMRVETRNHLARLLQKLKPEGWADRALTLLAETTAIDFAPLKRGHRALEAGEEWNLTQTWSQIAMEIDQPEKSAETVQRFREIIDARRQFIATVDTEGKPLRDGVELARRLSEFLQQRGRASEAAEFIAQGDQWKQELAQRFADDPGVLTDQFTALSNQSWKLLNELREAPAPQKAAHFAPVETQVREALALLEAKHPPLGDYDYERYLGSFEQALGAALVETARYAEAEAHLRRAIESRTAAGEKAKDAGDRVQKQWDTADSKLKLGYAVYKQGRIEEGRKLRREGAETKEKIAREHPSVSRSRDSGNAWRDVADILDTPDLVQDRLAALQKAAVVSREALKLAKAATPPNAGEVEGCRNSCGWVLLSLGIRQHEMKRLADAEATLREALAIRLEPVPAATKAESGRTKLVVNMRYDLAKTLLDMQRREDAQAQLDTMIAEMKALEQPAGHELPVFESAHKWVAELQNRLAESQAK